MGACKDSEKELERRRKISELAKGRPKSEVHRKHLSESLKGRKCWCEGLTKEISAGVRKISEKNRGRKKSKEECERLSRAMKKSYSQRTTKRQVRKEKFEALFLEGQSPFCLCGCGEHVTPNSNFTGWNKYIRGHTQRGRKHSEEAKRANSEKHKGNISWNKGLSKETNKAIRLAGRKISKSLKKTYRDKTKHPRWLGGRSYEPYGIEFNSKLKKFIRENYGNACVFCGKNQKVLKRRLSVHHIDYDKTNNNPENLISLCHSCHMKTNIQRVFWTGFFTGRLYEKIATLPEKAKRTI